MNATEHEVTFRLLCEADLPLLTNWLAQPHVVEWWAGEDASPTVEDTRSKYVPHMDEQSPVKAYIALLECEPIGFIQSYVALGCGDGWWTEEIDPGVRGIDQFLADGGKLGQGLGTRMVSAFTRRLLAESGVTKVQTDPDPRNARAIRCYAKSGFVPAGEIVTPDGPALLMVVEKGRLADATSAAYLPLNSDPACIVFRSFSSFVFLGFVQRLGAGGAG